MDYDDSAHQQQALLDNDGPIGIFTDMDDWTVDDVKKELPNVKLKLPDGSIVDGILYGNGLFVEVTWLDKTYGWMKPIEVAWETVVRCLNGNLPIIF
mgnify:CR=1 FL=1